MATWHRVLYVATKDAFCGHLLVGPLFLERLQGRRKRYRSSQYRRGRVRRRFGRLIFLWEWQGPHLKSRARTLAFGFRLRRFALLSTRGLLSGSFRRVCAWSGRGAFWLRGARLARKSRQIACEGGCLSGAGRVVLTQEARAGTPEFTRIAMADSAGTGENLRW